MRGFLIPLYTSLAEADADEADVLMRIPCSQCGKDGILLQGSIDSLTMDWYDGDDKIVGVCTDCYELVDLTKTMNSLLYR